MGGNRKYGFMRGNRGGFKPAPWFCDGCQRLHPGSKDRNGQLDGRSLCRKHDAMEMEKRQQNFRFVLKSSAPEVSDTPLRFAVRRLTSGFSAF